MAGLRCTVLHEFEPSGLAGQHFTIAKPFDCDVGLSDTSIGVTSSLTRCCGKLPNSNAALNYRMVTEICWNIHLVSRGTVDQKWQTWSF